MASGEWGEYQKLVLAELERLNSSNNNFARDINDIKLSLSLIQRTEDKLEKTVEIMDKRLVTVENSQLTEATIQKYRKWLVGGFIAFIASTVVPVVLFILGGAGGS